MTDPHPRYRSVARLMPPLLMVLLAASLLAACAAPAGGPGLAGLPEDATLAEGIDQFVLVDCMLPGQVRRLGTMATYVTARRHTKTTRRDCEIRGGEYVLFDRADYSAALATLLPKARAGDPVAQTYVGEIYEKGLGLPGPDYANAATWYRQAAASGHAPAQTSLGALYERGLGVPRDPVRALDLYRQAAGLTEDRLIFESQLEQERAAFRRELALRNQVAASLRRQLSNTQAALQRAGSEADRAALQARYDQQRRALEAQRREARSDADRRQRELQAARTLKAQEQTLAGTAGGRAAQIGKLELLRQEQYQAATAAADRLAGPP